MSIVVQPELPHEALIKLQGLVSAALSCSVLLTHRGYGDAQTGHEAALSVRGEQRGRASAGESVSGGLAEVVEQLTLLMQSVMDVIEMAVRDEKIRAEHLLRLADVYVRQSTLDQVQHNYESQIHQA